jgi:uncharacterized protein YdhG (YjbR/CyaY superfamily)
MAYKSPDEYISSFSIDIQKKLKSIRRIVQKNAKGAKEAMGYGVPAFKLNNDYLMYYAAFKKHIGIYPTPSAIKHFAKELADFDTAKGSVKFPFDKPIPLELIEKIVKFKVRELTK